MKFNFILVSSILFVFSCNDNKAVEKKLMDSIMVTHERVMASDEKLMDTKILLDSLLKDTHLDPKDSASKKAEMRLQNMQLTKADEAMDDWMHNFDPHKKGRANDEQSKYLQTQSKILNRVDSNIQAAIKSSSLVLQRIKK